jgi:hypothetical protein
MNTMKQVCLGLLGFILLAGPCFAHEKQVARPTANEVVLVVRIQLDPPPRDQDLGKIMGKKEIQGGHSLSLLCLPKGKATLLSTDQLMSGHLGELAMLKVAIPPSRTLLLQRFTVSFLHEKWWYTRLPVGQEADVPAGAQYLYLGTLVYHVADEFFTIDRVARVDEFDAAQEILRKQFGSGVQLYRASFRDIEQPQK